MGANSMTGDITKEEIEREIGVGYVQIKDRIKCKRNDQ